MANGIARKVETGDPVVVWEGKHYPFSKMASALEALARLKEGSMTANQLAADEDWIPEGRTYDQFEEI